MDKSKLSIEELINLVNAYEIVIKKYSGEAALALENKIDNEGNVVAYGRYEEVVRRHKILTDRKNEIIDEIEKRIDCNE